MSVLTKIDEYLDAREAYELADQKQKLAGKKMRAAEWELVDNMLAEGVPSVGLDTGIHVGLRKYFGVEVTLQNQQQIREWLLETTGDDAPFVIEKVNRAAVIEWLKEKIESEVLDEGSVPPYFKLNTRPGITVRGWKDREMKTGEPE